MSETATMSRQAQMAALIEAAGWGGAEMHPLAGDASTRRYLRLARRGHGAILMDQPRGAETLACPPDATTEERRKLGYNAMARLAGADCRPFAAVATFLNARGLSAPQILAHDYANGFLLIEDFGDGRFADLILGGQPERPLYETAIDTLVRLQAEAAPKTLSVPGGGGDVRLLGYDPIAMEAEVLLLAEWFYRAAAGKPIADDVREEYLATWRPALAQLPTDNAVMVLRDYHAENLMWLDKRSGAARAGLLDFQDALSGSPAYDLISLTEDARRDVSVELAHAMTERYVAARRAHGRFDEEAFRFAAALLATQRNTKIVGIFARLWKRDGKPRYTKYLPRMWGYLARDLSHPALAPLKTWFDRYVPQAWRGTLGN